MGYLLDSNLLIYSADPANAFLRPLVLDPKNYASIISQVETLGFHRLVLADATYFASVFAVLGLLPVNQAIVNRAIYLRQQRRITLGDSLIAATALEYGLEIATRNVTDFASISDLLVYNPFDS